jgi:hypothetical protein
MPRKRLLAFCLLLCCIGCNTSNSVYENVQGKHLILRNGEKQLFWFSGIHSNDPASPMFGDIQKEMTGFQPSYVLVEGGFDRIEYSSEDEAILDGESAYASHLARNLGFPVGNIEPTDGEINDRLLEEFSPREILSMYLFRQMVQSQREAKNKDIQYEQMLEEILHSGLTAGLPEIDLGGGISAALVDPYAGYPVDQENWLDVDAYSVVYDQSGELYGIWKAANDFRNQHILILLADLYKHCDRIFIVMGFDHARDLSTQLEELVMGLPKK